MHPDTERYAAFRAWRPALLAALVLAPLLLAGCEAYEHETEDPLLSDARPLEVDTAYAGQVLTADGAERYRFHAVQRGAYLIVVSDSTVDAPLTIEHRKKTCHVQGNGSCELITSPDQHYGFEVRETGGASLTYTVRVVYWDGRGGYEGQATDPVPLQVGHPHAGRVGVQEMSYYRFRTGSLPGGYTIRLADVHSDVYWRLFDREAYDVILYDCDRHAAAGTEDCQVGPLRPETDYFLLVGERSGVPGAYALSVLR